MAEEKKDGWHFGKNLTPNEDGSWYLGQNFDKFGQRITGRKEPRRYTFSDFASLVPGNRIVSYMWDVLTNDPDDPDDYYLGKVMDKMIEKRRDESKAQKQARVQHESRHSDFKQDGSARAEEEFKALQDKASRQGAATGGEIKREPYIFGGLTSKLGKSLLKKLKTDLKDIKKNTPDDSRQDEIEMLEEVIDELQTDISKKTEKPDSIISEGSREFDREFDIMRDQKQSIIRAENKARTAKLIEARKLTKSERKLLQEELPKRLPAVYTAEQAETRIAATTADDIIKDYEAGEEVIIYFGDPPDTSPDLGLNASMIDEILGKTNKVDDILGKGRTKKAEGGELDDQMNELAISEAPPRVEEQMDEVMEEPTMLPEEEQTMLPDEEMEEDYVDYVVNSTLDEQDKEYLESALMEDAKLSEIFDQVIESATEFSGSGPIEGPGSGMSDSIPARLSDGEFVFTAKAVEEIGADNLQQMMEDAEAVADQRQPAAYGGYMTEMENETVPIQTLGVREARRNIPQVAQTRRQVEEEMLKASPRRFYQPISG